MASLPVRTAFLAAVLAAVAFCQPAWAQQPTLADFARDPEVTGARLSPDGRHIALRVIISGRATLQVNSLPGLKVVGAFAIAGENDVADFHWTNNERLLVGVQRRLGTIGKPEYTGSLMAVNMDGSKVTPIAQYDASNQLDVSGDVRDFIVVDPLPDDHDHALIQRYDYTKRDFVLYRCNVYSGTYRQVMLPRLPNGTFWTDHNGEVRGQSGFTSDNQNVLMYRDPATSEWKDFDKFYSADGGMIPEVFDAAGRWVIAFDDRQEPVTGVYRVDLQTRKQELLYRDPVYDAASLLLGTDRQVIGASWEAERQRWTFFDRAHPDAALYTALRQSFGNVSMYFVNFSRDRSRVLLYTESDIAPPVYYVVDLKARSIISRIPTMPWIDAAQMARKQAINFEARDGLAIRGYLTLPPTLARGAKAPLVVLPHGGPHGVRDYWDFDPEVQLLASRGYAVLQVNFRGSSGYGRAFQNMGYGQWGRAMQDDIADATRWAAARADIDGSRVCIYGASYGAYAAMMGVERDPGLYRCAAGYAGIYDLAMMWSKGDIGDHVEGRSYLKLALGEDSAQWKARSPVNFVEAIQVPVFLAHGREDERAPVQHFQAMREALQKAGKPVEVLLKDHEGHGFYDEGNRVELYTKLLAFLDRHLGVSTQEQK